MYDRIKALYFQCSVLLFQTFDVFKFISRGFYEKHKYLFTLLLTLKIDLEKEYITFEEFQTFIKGIISFLVLWGYEVLHTAEVEQTNLM